jgi:UDP-N-acetylmuramyl pentapeptide phosphotransferase/UDP-N-acetylglucosamine-1-phosphate transferase
VPWWVVGYLCVLVGLSAGGIVDDARDRRPRWWLAMACLSACASVVLVLRYWEAIAVPDSPLSLLGLLAFAVAFDGASASSDLRAGDDGSGSAAGEAAYTRAGVALAMLILLPAYVWGLLAVLAT